MDEPPTIQEGAPGPLSDLKEWGPFCLLERVGQGAFGEVYRAWDPLLQREVALKLLLVRDSDIGTGAETVLREARSLAKVRHPNVVAVYGVDRHEGRVGFWSDFVKGRTLSALLELHGPYGAREATAIGIELCKALSAVHAAGLLHRDIKAGNVMREEGGRFLLMDFGLTHEGGSTQSFGGTPNYMAPELLSGGQATVASDIYAMGVLLYHLVTGKYPVEAASIHELWSAHSTGKRRSLYEDRPDLPEDFARAIERALDAESSRRFQNAGQMLRALTESAGTRVEPADANKSKKPLYAAAGLVLLFAGAGAAWWRLSPGQRPGTGAHQAFLEGQADLDAYYVPHNIDKALEAFQKTIRLDPQFAPAFGGICRANFLNYRDTNRAEFAKNADDACARALQLDPDLTSVHVTLGMLYTLTAKSDTAAHELNEALRLDPANAEVYAARAELYLSQGRIADVAPAYLRAIDLAPRDWRWPNQLGYFYMTRGNLDEAVKQFQTAIRLSRQNAKPYNQLGMAYRRQHKLPEAEKQFVRAVELLPISNHILNLGLVYSEEGNLPKAVELYKRALDLNPSAYITWANLGEVYNRMPGEAERTRESYLHAVELAEQLLQRDVRNTLVTARLATYYAVLGREDQSVPLIRKAVALAPEDPEILYDAGWAYEMLHRREDALVWIGKALDHKYSFEALKQSPTMAALRSDPRFAALSSKHN